MAAVTLTQYLAKNNPSATTKSTATKPVTTPAVVTSNTPAPVVTQPVVTPVTPAPKVQNTVAQKTSKETLQGMLTQYTTQYGSDLGKQRLATDVVTGKIQGITGDEGYYKALRQSMGTNKGTTAFLDSIINAAQPSTSQQTATPQPAQNQPSTTETAQQVDPQSSVRSPTAEQLAQWAIKGGRTDLQNNSYWSSQPDEVKQAAWAIIQGQNQTNGKDPTTGQPIPTETADTSGTNNIFPSDQISNPQSYQDLLNAGQDRWDTFLDTQVSAFQKLQEDFSALMATQISSIQIDSKAMMDQLTKMQQSYDTERLASIARIQTSANELNNIAQQEADNATKANELAAKEADSQYGLQIDMMRDNNSRYMGYMQGKFEVAGMLDSSAGLQLLGKYMTSADMNMAYVTQDRVNTQQEFLNTGREIMTNYFKETYEAETTKNEQIAKVNTDMFDRIDKIQVDKLTSTAKKNEQILEVMKEGASMQADIQSKISQEVQAISQAKIQEAESKFNILQAIDNEQRYWNDFKEQKRQSAVSEEQWNMNYNLEYAKYQQDQAKAGDDAYLDYLNAVNVIGNLPLSDEVKKQILEAYDPSLISSAYEYTDPNTGESLNLEQRILNTLDKISSGTAPEDLQKIFDESAPEGGKSVAQFVYEKLGANYQCVQFVRDVIPDLPTGLNTIQDKIDILVNGSNGIAKGSIPKVGDVMVLNWKMQGVSDDQQPGHVALVTTVDLENKRVEISQYNVPANKFSKQWVDIGDADIEGYWRSPNLKKVSGNVFETKGELTANQVSNKVDRLKAQINTNVVLKAYNTTQQYTQKIDTAYVAYQEDPRDAAAIEGIQVSFEKLFDPTSVVMPAEAKRTAEMQGVIEQGAGLFNKWRGASASSLSPETIENMYALSKELAGGMDKYAANVLAPIYYDSTEYGFNINSVLGPDLQEVYNKIYYSPAIEMTSEEEDIYDEWD